MNSRRKFLKKGLGLSSLFLWPGSDLLNHSILEGDDSKQSHSAYTSLRPAKGDRKYYSQAVEDLILRIKPEIKNPKLAWLFENCFPNTLDTTVFFSEKNSRPDSFIITGDIHSMWLRDSSAQVWPYLSLVKSDPSLKRLFQGLINRQTDCILLDPYANAFNEGPGIGEVYHDLTEIKPGIHERKWEIDSLCYPIRLAYHYWKITGDTLVLDSRWKEAMKTILQTFIVQQRKKDKGPYHFQRETAVLTDTVAGSGFGNPIRPNGLICSMFRPSDDSTIYAFLIPSNLFAKRCLEYLAEMSDHGLLDKAFGDQCLGLSREIDQALDQFGTYMHPKYGKILAYEVDGFGNQLFMDDANVPSLLALPYLDAISVNNPVYKNTRAFVWSLDNPYFFVGSAGEGIGGPHVGLDYIWPMSLIMKALTSNQPNEIQACLRTLMGSDGDKGFMHESFFKDNPGNFTRSWFAWVNTLFGELIVKIYHENPKLLSL